MNTQKKFDPKNLKLNIKKTLYFLSQKFGK